jgi:hypothetical protein
MADIRPTRDDLYKEAVASCGTALELGQRWKLCSFCAGYFSRWNRSSEKVSASNCRFPLPRPVLTVGSAFNFPNIPERAVEMMGLWIVQLKDSNEIENEILPLIEQDH